MLGICILSFYREIYLMKRNYLLVTAAVIVVLIAGYVLKIHEITSFAKRVFDLSLNYWILIPALILPFIVGGKYYWIILAFLGLLCAVLVQVLVQHKANVNVNLTLMMTCAFLCIAFVVNLVRVLIRD